MATGVVSAVIVDCVRLTIYGASYGTARIDALPPGVAGLVACACLAAFTGSFLGARLLEKVTLRAVQIIVAAGMIGVGLGLAAGLI